MMILKTIKSTIVGISLLLLVNSCNRQPPLEQTFIELCDRYEVPAAAFFKIENNQPQFFYHGINNKGQPVDKNTVFEAASLSKVVFYTLLEQEFTSRNLSLDSSLASFGLSESDLKNLATHYPNAPLLAEVKPICLKASVREVSNHISGVDGGIPGIFSYSESGYLMLQLLLEKITCKSIQELYVERLNIDKMSFLWKTAYEQNTTDGFIDIKTKERSIRKHKKGFSNGTLTTSIKGLSEFCKLLLDQTDGTDKVSIDSYPSLFWSKGRGYEVFTNGRTFQWHFGSNYCFNSFIIINPKENKAYGILTNSVSAKQLMQPLFSNAINEEYLVCFDYIKWY